MLVIVQQLVVVLWPVTFLFSIASWSAVVCYVCLVRVTEFVAIGLVIMTMSVLGFMFLFTGKEISLAFCLIYSEDL